MRITFMISINGILVYLQEKLFLLPGNKSHPAFTKPQFSERDPRLKFAVKKPDPRNHIALVCGENVCMCIGKTVLLMALTHFELLTSNLAPKNLFENLNTIQCHLKGCHLKV